MRKKIYYVCKDRATSFAAKVINKCFSDLMSEVEDGTYPFDTAPEEAAEYFIEDMVYTIRHDSSNMFRNEQMALNILVDGGWSTVADVVADIPRLNSVVPKCWAKRLCEKKTRSKKS